MRSSLSILTLFSLRMKRVNRSQNSVAATQVHVRVISSRFDLSDVPGKIKQQTFLKMTCNTRAFYVSLPLK